MAMISSWPDWLDQTWAKSPEKGVGGESESLAQHTWDVLKRLAEFVHLRPHLPETLGTPRLWHILFWAAFLHDFGKAAKGFQDQLRGIGKWPHRHEVLSLAFVDWIATALSPNEQAWLVAAIVSHHKDAAEIAQLYAPPDDSDDDQLVKRVAEMDESTLRGLWRWLNECAADWIKELGLVDVALPTLPDQDQAVQAVQKQGVGRIYHWLRVYRQLVQQVSQSKDHALIVGTLALRGHLINADHSASAHVGAVPRLTLDVDAILKSRGLSHSRLFKHQKTAQETVGSALLIAPTGSGKTEAALLWAAAQSTDLPDGLPRLFYTLPYQASMNAMQLRLAESFGPENVGLQHGRSLLALYRLLLESDYDPKSAARQAKWARNLAELNYPPVRIFSPYQMLKGMYRLKGYEALLSDYYGAAFIFDEIHAYEVGRLALILKTIEYLRQNFGARFFVMSATFPALVKGWLHQVLGGPAEIAADEQVFDAFRRHRLSLLEGELLSDAGIKRIVTDTRAGKSVLVVCNRVDRAQAVFNELGRQLTDSVVHVELLHGRFNGRDRLAKEKIVRESAGSTSRQRKPIVLVATQVIEVSLDIDLDTIYTDPAPLEALVQRFGRVNRRRRQVDLAPVYVYSRPDDGQKIYDPELVARTLTILNREDGKPLDESAVGGWLDEIYSAQVAENWESEYAKTAKEFEAACIRTLRPFAADDGLEESFYRAFDGLEVLPESLYDEYKALREEEPIRASELLVPISWGRYHALAKEGRVLARERGEPYIVRARYDPVLGLTFEGQGQQ